MVIDDAVCFLLNYWKIFKNFGLSILFCTAYLKLCVRLIRTSLLAI